MADVVIYTTTYCPFCFRAKALLKSKKVEFEEIDVTRDNRLREEMQRLSGRTTVPQIFINGTAVGGFDEIRQLESKGELDRLLGKNDQRDGT